jgi:hypothetical protein
MAGTDPVNGAGVNAPVLNWVQCPSGESDSAFSESAPNALIREVITRHSRDYLEFAHTAKFN